MRVKAQRLEVDMVELRDQDRRALTAGVLRIVKASTVVATAASTGQWGLRAPGTKDAGWMADRIWDGNRGVDSVRLVLQRTILAACEQGRGVAELARSVTGYTVVLATLTRGSIEALGRVNWVLSSGSADEVLVRHASLEYGDLRYPLQHGLKIRRQGRLGETWTQVDVYRRSIVTCLSRYGLGLAKAGVTQLTTTLLSEIYNEAPQLYSGLSAAAHGQGWATGNFVDVAQSALRRDDQMVIEYCAYVIESTTLVTEKLTRALAADRASVERWASERDQVNVMLRTILNRRDQSSLVH
jgi:hypothetical protein